MLNFFRSLTINRLGAAEVGLTAGVAALGAWMLARVGALLPVLLVLLAVMVLDYITGMVKAGIAGTLNSTRGWQGLLKKLMYAVTVAIAMVADYLLYIGGSQIGIDMHESAYFGTLVSIWLIINECISILENLSEIGVPMPGFLGRILQRVQDKVNETGNDMAESGNSESEDDAT
nr:MAG TPA: holin [Caudoviricetes sp.]